MKAFATNVASIVTAALMLWAGWQFVYLPMKQQAELDAYKAEVQAAEEAKPCVRYVGARCVERYGQ